MHEILNLDLFKKVTSHYEKFYKLQPLTAKVYTYFIFNNCREGLTFDFLVEFFQVSKSSMSNSLHSLMELNFIEDFKNENERKRHFRVNKDLFMKRLNDVYERLENEKEVYKELKEYKMDVSNQVFNSTTFDIYIDHLDQVTDSLDKTIQNLNLYIKSNEN
jgi:DNA-binding transcriptional regulator GbsR (MarR family)